MPKKTKDVVPDTTRVIEGFRDTGYTFDASIADIIDNSIGPGCASTISVTVAFGPNGNLIVQVADDGIGMDLDGLENAMRYGAQRQENPNSLSKFGLGLKTASTEFCRRLVVISRPEGSDEAVAAAWDLDAVAEANAWVLEHDLADDNESDALDAALEDLAAWSEREDADHGTAVMWEKVDRLLKTKDGKEAKNQAVALKRTVANLRDHLRMVFQRYLDPADDRARTVMIFLNDEKLEPWDPFVEGKGGDLVMDKEFVFEVEGGLLSQGGAARVHPASQGRVRGPRPLEGGADLPGPSGHLPIPRGAAHRRSQLARHRLPRDPRQQPPRRAVLRRPTRRGLRRRHQEVRRPHRPHPHRHPHRPARPAAPRGGQTIPCR